MKIREIVEDRKIIDFWKWFTDNEKKLESDKITNQLVDELNHRILSLGDFNWEIREGIEKGNMLIISPGGDVSLLKETKKIIELSPALVNWEFYYYKPAKDWDFHFSLEEGNNIKRMINAGDWEYVLLKFPDETYDILIKADNLKFFQENERLVAVDIVLESILGEELSLTLIQNVGLVDSFPSEYYSQKNSIKYLKQHVR